MNKYLTLLAFIVMVTAVNAQYQSKHDWEDESVFAVNKEPGSLTWAKGAYDSIHGEITSSWKLDNEILTLDVTVPPNTTATVRLPVTDIENIIEAGGERFQAAPNGGISVEVGSGSYTFVFKYVNRQ